MQCIKMHLEMHVIILCLLSVVCADRSIELAKCQRNADNNSERFSFQQLSQNFTIAAANNSIETKNVKTETIKSVDVIKKQLVFKESTIQEDGNFCVSYLVFH